MNPAILAPRADSGGFSRPAVILNPWGKFSSIYLLTWGPRKEEFERPSGCKKKKKERERVDGERSETVLLCFCFHLTFFPGLVYSRELWITRTSDSISQIPLASPTSVSFSMLLLKTSSTLNWTTTIASYLVRLPPASPISNPSNTSSPDYPPH